ncbi:MAG TPA: isoleucine--tRNA ligase [Dehalococcoidales bacterium]|nr:isoleucine--tRNA ligase [Dehalococcoidales bacterium]
MFRPVSSQLKLPQVEEKILNWWKENKVFERSVENRKGGPRFTLYEGPPTANGSPGIHHVLSRIFKDIIPRHRAMKGYYTPRIGGWDTHGLPVELEVERELGLSSKTQIEEYGIAKFNAKCRESVFKYLKDWNALTERIAYWCDLEHPYVTMENYYIETVWWAIKQMWDRGLIYLGYKTAAHCPRCGTSLSSHEVALGYEEDTEDPSVYIKFKIVPSSLTGSEVRERLHKLFTSSNKPAYFLAWTTTPWTLPGNTALAVAAEAEYAVVETDEEYLVFALDLLSTLGFEASQVVEEARGADFVAGDGKEAVEYEPLYNPHEYGVERRRFQSGAELLPQESDGELTYRVIATDFVSMEDGTGIVHVAPAFGEVDFEAGKEQGLDFVQQVDLQGNITGNYSFSGKFVKDADPIVIEELKEKGLLYRSETIRHTYPFCWRCSTPLLYYVKESWYIKTTAVKDRLISGNNGINWYPEHIKHGRFGDWLENNVDWAFSRERYWGTPLPIWRCESCDYRECVGGVDDLKGKPGFSGLKEPLDLHRPYVDEITFDCPQCGGAMRRVNEVIDCWFDSGAMPVAQVHYPFENETLLEDGRFPADYICEAVDQTRGWFYSLHAISTLLFSRPCFLNCICLGHILDAKGEKMSKAKGNVIEPNAVIDKYGADALRWYFFTSSPPGNVRRFSTDMVSEVTRRFLLTLWNTYSFFVNYANIDQFTPVGEGILSHSELDHWVISELNQLVADVDNGLENYDPSGAGRKIEAFVGDLSNWYVRRSRRRFWKSENDADKLAAYTTLYQCLVTLSKLLAPFIPFVAEEMYQNLVCSVSPDQPESVHLADFPVADMDKINQHLADDIRLVMQVSSLGRAARSEAGIKVRQPLSRLLVKVASERHKRALKHLAPQVLEEVNVKALDVVDDMPVTKHKEWPLASEGDVMVMLDTDITTELAAEGMARELVRRLQMMRRSAGFEIANHIIVYYQGDEYIKSVIADFTDYIRQETLSERLIDGVPEEGAYTESFKLEGHELKLGVKKQG